jgi:hypothetical protein
VQPLGNATVLVAYQKNPVTGSLYPYPRVNEPLTSAVTLAPGYYMLSLSWLRGGVVYLGAATNAQAPLTTSYGTLVDFNLYQRQTSGVLECKVIGSVLSAWVISSPNYNIDSTADFSCIGMSVKERHKATSTACLEDIRSGVHCA